MREAAKDAIARHRGQPVAIGNEGISARFDGPVDLVDPGYETAIPA